MGMDKRQLKEILDGGENLQVEFKSDQKCLSDRDLIAAVNTLQKRHNKLRPAGTPIWEH